MPSPPPHVIRDARKTRREDAIQHCREWLNVLHFRCIQACERVYVDTSLCERVHGHGKFIEWMAVSTAMGQTGQRTLHPFFGTGHGRPDVSSSECEGPPSQPEEQALPIESSIPGQSGNSSDLVPIQDDDPNSSRRKRQKTNPPEAAASTPHDEPEASLSIPISLAEQLKNAAQSTSSDIQEPSSDPTSELTQNPPSERRSTRRKEVTETEDSARKTLKLNPNGKLLSSPASTKVDESVDGEGRSKEKRRSGRRKKAQTQQSRITVLRYGTGTLSRKAIGGVIDAILNGPRSSQVKDSTPVPPPAPAPAPISAPTPTLVPVAPKATHPFFLGRLAPKPTVSGETQMTDLTESSAAIPKDSRSTLGNTLNSHTSSPASRTCNTLSTFKRHPKFPDPVEPIWPPRDAVHIRDNGPDEQRDSLRPLLGSYEQKKAKGSTINVSPSENVLSTEWKLLHIPDHSKTNRNSRKAILRRPHKKRCDGKTILELASKELSWNRTAYPDRGADRRQHGAISYLLSLIPHSATSFDKGTFDDLPWAHKYAPTTAAHVLQTGPEAAVLRYWLQSLVVSGVDTGRPLNGNSRFKAQGAENSKKRKKKRKRDKELDGFIVSSGDEEGQMDEITDPDEDELAGGVTVPPKRTLIRSGDAEGSASSPDQRKANAVLISGPSGCGKTAAVHAVAKELGFEIFEINPGSRRSARDVVERVGDMTQNHLVQLLKQIDEAGSVDLSAASEAPATKPDSGLQKTMNSFFKQSASHPDKENKKEKPSTETREQHDKPSTVPTSQKQSLILLEEVDILFEEDKNFWNGVLALLNQSRRPIIMTCNDENLLPLDDLSFHAILRFKPPPCDLAVDYLLLLCASEGHILDREAVTNLYTVLKEDLRATIMQLDFWCQMAVGSKKCGLDWIRGSQKCEDGSGSQRVASCNTYTKGMDWYSQDIARGENDHFKKETQLITECLDQWDLGIMDWQEARLRRFPTSRITGDLGPLDALRYTSAEADMKSSMDLITAKTSSDATRDTLDTTMPAMAGRQRSNYTEAYQFLPADLRTDYADMSANIGSTLSLLLDSLSRESHKDNDEEIIGQILESVVPHRPSAIDPAELQDAFEAIKENLDIFIHSPGRQSPSFENGTAAITQDLAPYVRAIVAYDLHLEQRRLALSNLVSQNGNKRMRTTRASRAALEGGDKANTRRERWFTNKLNPARVLATGGQGWQDLLVRHEEEDTEEEQPSDGPRARSVESSSDGGV